MVVDIYNERLKASRHQQVADEDGVIEEAVASVPIGRRVMAWEALAVSGRPLRREDVPAFASGRFVSKCATKIH